MTEKGQACVRWFRRGGSIFEMFDGMRTGGEVGWAGQDTYTLQVFISCSCRRRASEASQESVMHVGEEGVRGFRESETAAEWSVAMLEHGRHSCLGMVVFPGA